MTLENTQVITYVVIDIAAVLTTIFAILFIMKMRGKEQKDIKQHMMRIFYLLGIAYILYTIAEISWSVIEELMGQNPQLGFPEYFWIMGALFFMAGFAYFTVYTYKRYQASKKSIITLILVTLVSAAIVAYLVGNFIVGFQEGESVFEIFLDYYYPVTSAIILILSISVYSFYKELEELGKPLLFLALSTVVGFIADMLYTYWSWNDIYGVPGLISDSLYGIDYILSAAAFYLLFRLAKK